MLCYISVWAALAPFTTYSTPRAQLHDIVREYAISLFTEQELVVLQQRMVSAMVDARPASEDPILCGLGAWQMQRGNHAARYVKYEGLYHVRVALEDCGDELPPCVEHWLSRYPVQGSFTQKQADDLSLHVILTCGPERLQALAESAYAREAYWLSFIAFAASMMLAFMDSVQNGMEAVLATVGKLIPMLVHRVELLPCGVEGRPTHVPALQYEMAIFTARKECIGIKHQLAGMWTQLLDMLDAKGRATMEQMSDKFLVEMQMLAEDSTLGRESPQVADEVMWATYVAPAMSVGDAATADPLAFELWSKMYKRTLASNDPATATSFSVFATLLTRAALSEINQYLNAWPVLLRLPEWQAAGWHMFGGPSFTHITTLSKSMEPLLLAETSESVLASVGTDIASVESMQLWMQKMSDLGAEIVLTAAPYILMALRGLISGANHGKRLGLHTSTVFSDALNSAMEEHDVGGSFKTFILMGFDMLATTGVYSLCDLLGNPAGAIQGAKGKYKTWSSIEAVLKDLEGIPNVVIAVGEEPDAEDSTTALLAIDWLVVMAKLGWAERADAADMPATEEVEVYLAQIPPQRLVALEAWTTKMAWDKRCGIGNACLLAARVCEKLVSPARLALFVWWISAAVCAVRCALLYAPLTSVVMQGRVDDALAYVLAALRDDTVAAWHSGAGADDAATAAAAAVPPTVRWVVVPSEGGVSQQQEISVPVSAGEELSSLLDGVAAALGRGAGAVVELAGWDVSAPFPSFTGLGLTEKFLCHACSCQTFEETETARQEDFEEFVMVDSECDVMMAVRQL